jgi:hypothetical protein
VLCRPALALPLAHRCRGIFISRAQQQEADTLEFKQDEIIFKPMQEVQQLCLPPGQTIKLAPGSYQLPRRARSVITHRMCLCVLTRARSRSSRWRPRR